MNRIPINTEAYQSSSYIDPFELLKPSSSKAASNLHIKYTEHGPGEYTLQESCCVGTLPLSPKSYGKPSTSKPTSSSAVIKDPPTVFIKGGFLDDEDIDDIDSWIFFDENDQVQPEVERYNNGFRIIKNMGYKGHGGLGSQEQGHIKPIIMSKKFNKQGLGYQPEVL